MKSLFNFEEYRKNLAEDLKKEIKEKGFDSARQKLSEEENTAEYYVSNKLKRGFKRGFNKRFEQNANIFTWRREGKDGEELLKQWECVDISDKIPQELKLSIDMQRHNTIISEKQKEQENKKGLEEFEKTAGISRERFDNLINEISKGKYFDKKYLNHAVGPGILGDQSIRHELAYNSLVKGKPFDPNSVIVGGGEASTLFVVPGENYFALFTTPLVIFSGKNPAFLYAVSDANNIERKYNDFLDKHPEFYTQDEKKNWHINTEEINKYLDTVKVIDEDGSISYKFEGSNREPYTLPLLLQAEVPIYLDKDSHLQGIFINRPKIRDSMKGETYFGKKIYSSDITWLNLADTVIDLPNGKAWYRKYH